jgi:hypothetical protein
MGLPVVEAQPVRRTTRTIMRKLTLLASLSAAVLAIHGATAEAAWTLPAHGSGAVKALAHFPP